MWTMLVAPCAALIISYFGLLCSEKLRSSIVISNRWSCGVFVLWNRPDVGEVSDDDSTATASDVDNDNSLLASAAMLSDSADNQDMLHKVDRGIKDHVSPSPPAAEAAVSAESDKAADTESVKAKLPLETASQPMVRLERLSVDRVKKAPSEDTCVIRKQTPVAEHNYFSTSEPPDDRLISRASRDTHPVIDSDNSVDIVSTELPAPTPTLPPNIAVDHCYCVPFLPTDGVFQPPVSARGAETAAPQRRTKRRLSDLTNVPGSRELSSILPPPAPPPPRPRYQPRDLKSEIMTLLEFILCGVDAEDIMFLRRCYEQLLQYDSAATDWLNDTHWVDHPPTFFIDPAPQPPPKKRRKGDILDDQLGHHLTGQSVRLSISLQGASRW